MEQRYSSQDESFFDRFTATRDRPLGFQITVSILVLTALVVALTTALLHL